MEENQGGRCISKRWAHSKSPLLDSLSLQGGTTNNLYIYIYIYILYP